MTRGIASSRGSRWAIVVAILIGVFAALPWFQGIPKGADTLAHFYRAVQVNNLMREGVVYSSWAPDMAYGFGYPLFSYQAPLAYYLTSLISLAGLELAAAFQITYVVTLVLASVSMFVWARDIVSAPAALVSAALFVLSPYLMAGAVSRGNLPELMALALVPLILWSTRRFIVFGHWIYTLLSVFSFAILTLTNNVTALICVPVLLFYVILVTVSRYMSPVTRVGFSWTRPVLALCLLILGAGIAAYFWIPALVESDFVQLSRLLEPSGRNFASNFLPILQAVALPFSTDLNLVNRTTPISFSLVAVILALVGVFSLKRFDDQPEKLGHIPFTLVGTLLSFLLTLSLSIWIWESTPALQYLQFPWGFYGWSTLFLAFLGGVGADVLFQPGRLSLFRVFVPAVLVGLVVLYIFPWQYSNYHESLDATIDGMRAYEAESGRLGTTELAEFLPADVEQPPEVSAALTAGDGHKLSEESLPRGAKVESAAYGPLRYELIVDTPKAFVARFNTLFFEGWQARIDDQPAPILVLDSQGLIGIEVPRGRHELQVYFGETPVRIAATFISAVALLLTIVVTVVTRRRAVIVGDPDHTGFNLRAFIALVLVALTVVGLTYIKAVYVDPGGNLLLSTRLTGSTVADADTQLDANFENEIVLMGVDHPFEIVPGEKFDVTLFWRANRELEKNYSISAAVVDRNGIVLTQDDRESPGGKPTSQWELTEYAVDKLKLAMPEGTPPGEYYLRVTVYEYGLPSKKLDLLDESGSPRSDPADVIAFNVARPKRMLELEDFPDVQVDDVKLWDDVSLVGYSIPDYVVRAGDMIYPVLFWQAVEDPRLDHKIMIGLLAESGQLTELFNTRMINGFPTFKWEKDDLWRVPQPLLIPPTLEAGNYLFMVGALEGLPVSLGAIEIAAPEHVFEIEESMTPAATLFDNTAELAGFSIQDQAQAGATTPVTVTWKILGETRTNFRTFVQMVDDEGRLITGSDMVPGNWERPATGWVDGEYITDEHLLAIPPELKPGDYQVKVGIYDYDTLERIETPDGEDSWLIPVPLKIVQP